MKKKLAIILMIVLMTVISICSSDTGKSLIPVPGVADGILKYGYIDLEGNRVIPPIYNYAGNFENGKATVAKEILGMRQTYTDENGETVVTTVPVKSNYIDDGIYVNYRGMLGDGSTLYVINEKGETILKSDHFGILDFFNNYFITYKDYQAGLADNTGKVIFTDVVNDSIRSTYNLLIVYNDGYYAIYDKNLNVIQDKLESFCFVTSQRKRFEARETPSQSRYCVLKKGGKSFIYDITAKCKYMDINMDVTEIQQVDNFLVVRDAADRKLVPINLTAKKVLYNTKSDVVFSFYVNKSKVVAYSGAVLPVEYHGGVSIEAFIANDNGRILKTIKKADPSPGYFPSSEGIFVFTQPGSETWTSGGARSVDNTYTIYNADSKKFTSITARSIRDYLEAYRKYDRNYDRNFYYNGNAMLVATAKETVAYDKNFKIIFRVNNFAKKTIVKSADKKYQFLRESKNISVLDNKGKVLIKPMEYVYEDDNYLYLKENKMVKCFDKKDFSFVTEEKDGFVLLDGGLRCINYSGIADKNNNVLVETKGIRYAGYNLEASIVPNRFKGSNLVILRCPSQYFFFKKEGDGLVYITKGKNFNMKMDKHEMYFDMHYLCVQTESCLEYYDNDGKLIYRTDSSIPLRN